MANVTSLTKLDRISGFNRSQQAQDHVREPDAAAPDACLKLERDIKSDENIPAASSTPSPRSAAASATLLVAPPKTSKTVMLQNIAHTIRQPPEVG